MEDCHLIKTKKDIETFKKQTNCLHDGHILSAEYQNHGMTSHSDFYDFTQTELKLRICVTSIEDTVVEILFRDITEGQLRLGYYEILDSALAFLEDGRLLWTDACCTNREYYKEESYIIAKEMGWRIV